MTAYTAVWQKMVGVSCNKFPLWRHDHNFY